ncbi:MAG: HPr kinase/phosphatase C-terminal domain-containing protein [Rhodospirillales bacterium]|jgi:serine kinase of HPr protein (carbohydrate metabolism regulator)
MTLVHATAVALDGQGILLLGPSGSGKSDLALRLIGEGAFLISDDQVEIVTRGGRPLASPPAPIAGLIEARGVGLLRLPYLAPIPLFLAVELVLAAQVERLPDPAFWTQEAISLPLLRLCPFEASVSVKLRLALRAENCSIMRPQ